MRSLKFCLIFAVLGILAVPALANNVFYSANKDLRRVGLAEILGMDKVSLEGTDFRLEPDFTLGYGDSVEANFWGKIEANYSLQVNRDGNIIIPFLGKINIVSLTLNEAKEVIRESLEKKYTNVNFDLTVANVQNIRVTVLGNVNKPGPYSISPFCRIAEVVARAGGPSNYGTLIDIKLMRNDAEVVSFNVYDFIFKGDTSKNVRLKHGDLIYVPIVRNLIAIKGDVIYPGIYEVPDDSTLERVIAKTGSILSTKVKRKIYILRIDPEKNIIREFTAIEFDSVEDIAKKYSDVVIESYDTIVVTTTLDCNIYPQDPFWEVSITGQVKTPGVYLIEEGEGLSSLLKRAGGFKDGAFISGMVFTRDSLKEKEKSTLGKFIKVQEEAILKEEARLGEEILTQEELSLRRKSIGRRREVLNLLASRQPSGRIVVDLEEVMNGKNDITLEKGDKVYIPAVPDWVLVTGEVRNSTAINFEKNKKLNYYLDIAGGITPRAAQEEIYIIKADGSVVSKDTGYGEMEQGDIVVVPPRTE